MVRIQIKIAEETYKALRMLSIEEQRDCEAEAGHLIREVLIALGYLPDRSEAEAGETPDSRGPA